MISKINERLQEIKKLKATLAADNIAKQKSIKASTQKSRKEQGIDNFFASTVEPILSKIPESNGSRYYQKLELTIGIIADEFLYKSFEGIANFIYITPSNFEKYVDKLDLFIVATAWKGLDGEWQGLANINNIDKRQAVSKFIKECNDKDIKTVFYSKEDPVNYEYFIGIAKQCDYVYTTAREILGDYKEECGHERVATLEFGINPLYHNPIGLRNHDLSDKVIFSGSWYEKYPERCKDNQLIFDGIIKSKYDLKIIDRNYHLFYGPYIFPDKYNEFISPAIEHKKLQKLHKLYNWAINLNTIQFSQTMFANRVYELQAMGNIQFSNYSIGVNSQFPNVFIIEDENEIPAIINAFDDQEIYRHQMVGVRTAQSKHCNHDKLVDVFKNVGLSVQQTIRKVIVLVEQHNDSLQSSFERQTFTNKTIKTVNELEEADLEENDIIIYFSEKYFYDEFYIEDLVNGFKYTNSDYITKDAYFNGVQFTSGINNNYVDYVKDLNLTAYWAKSFTLNQFKGKQLTGTIENGYSIDPFEVHNLIRTTDEQQKEYKYSVLIPAYNNGDHLLNKCFNSLRRSSTFMDMEVVIVDDGSTDNYTPKIIARLARLYPNVKTYFYQDGGSGSASRPRNKGIELASSEYITYLDPDNEALNDGYTKLYEKITSESADLVVGNMLRLAEGKLVFDPNKGKVNTLSSGKEFIEEYNFPTQSTQALMLKKCLLTDNDIDMVHGAVGEDTLFYHELLLHSKYTVFINEMIHIYYAAVEGSTVNTISSGFFKKHLLLEKERVLRFSKYGLLEAYKTTRFEYYFRYWYLDKFKIIKAGDEEETKQVLVEIFNMYSSLDSVDDAVIKSAILSFSN
ncbi:glycosyltransferase [Thalassotalea fonticola]|uniref:Glycosyltransferase n=1 Tax=Thalassotalea fonticola TaxID=3065649 RepID=A0ABZ0GNM2_9GAMM|nr:glycosyltransferase [Colwelliaceae bacterium S1-1]